MAQVVDERRSCSKLADDFLSYLMDEWGSVTEIADDWPALDAVRREDIIMEWGIGEGRLHDLRRWAAAGRLTARQRERYAELLRLVEMHRPMLQRLFEEGEPVEERRAA